MTKRAQITGIVLFALAFHCFAQSSYKVTNYTSREGLSNSSIYDIVKDSSGFLWIATELGLNKFDGRKFYTYTPNSHNLPDNSITNMAVVGRNKLFCSTGTSGYFIFDSQLEKPEALSVHFSSFVYKSHKTKFRKGKVYIKSNASAEVLVFDLQKNRITDTIQLQDAQVYDFDIAEDGSVILVSDKGLKIWNAGIVSDYRLNGYDLFGEPVKFFMNMPATAYFSRKGVLYIYDKLAERVKDSVKYSTADVPVNSLLVSKEGIIWFSTFFPAGVFQYDPANKKLQDFSSNLAGTENSVGSIIQDDEKNIWVGTYSSGLYKISPSVFDPLPLLRNENVYFARMHEQGKLFVGTKTGLSVIDLKTNLTQHVSIDESNNGYIYSVMKARSKYVVLNNRIDGIKYCQDKTKFQFICKRSICMLNDTLALVGAWNNRLELISLRTDTPRILKTIDLGKKGDRNRVNCFLKDSHGLIWCGTDVGLYVLSPDLLHCKKISGEVFRYRIIDMLQTNEYIYIATQKGLITYTEGKLSFVKKINNRPVDKINSLCVDKQGSVFLGTLNGLFKLRPNGTDIYFDEDDGLISREINRLVYDPWSNALLIATNEGICQFNLNRFKYMVKSVPKIHFDRITSSGVIDFNSGVYNLEKRNVNLYFGSTSFNHASSISYRWSADGNGYHYILNPSIEFAAMTYGKHTIEIYASNDGNHWSRPLIVALDVKTPFYETIWFLLLSGGVMLVITALLFKRRIGKIRSEAGVKAELEQKLVLLKYEALNAAINPHFIFNALNSVQHYINTNQNDEASDYLAKFGFLIRQTIENATEHFISINDEVERLKMYMDLERMRFNDGFAYEIKVDSSLNTFKKKLPNMILQPLIENSIVHGFKHIDYQGYIRLHFLRANNELLIILEDNGRGLVKAPSLQQASEKKKSIALENIKERIRTVPKASIKISDKSFIPDRGSGVFIEITLPIDL